MFNEPPLANNQQVKTNNKNTLQINLEETAPTYFLEMVDILDSTKLLNDLILGLICSVIRIYLTQSINLFVLLLFSIGTGGEWINQSFYNHFTVKFLTIKKKKKRQ